MARYLVTGGCGFIGSHLVDALLAAGHDIVVVDDLSTGKRDNLDPRAQLVVGDVADSELMRKAAAEVDGFFHLAAIASVVRSTEDWLGTHRTNLTGTVTVLDAARSARYDGPVPVIYASSAAVYGNASEMPIAETTATVPLTAYGADKLGSELHARVAWTVHQVPTTGLRFFNVYGPRQDPHSPYSGVISIFAARAAAGQPIRIDGDGLQLRDFVYVADVVAHLMAAMATCAGNARVFNVCTGRAASILELAQLITRVSGTGAAISHGPARLGDIRCSLGNPARAAAELGVTAGHSLELGVTAFCRSLDPVAARPVEMA